MQGQNLAQVEIGPSRRSSVQKRTLCQARQDLVQLICPIHCGHLICTVRPNYSLATQLTSQCWANWKTRTSSIWSTEEHPDSPSHPEWMKSTKKKHGLCGLTCSQVSSTTLKWSVSMVFARDYKWTTTKYTDHSRLKPAARLTGWCLWYLEPTWFKTDSQPASWTQSGFKSVKQTTTSSLNKRQATRRVTWWRFPATWTSQCTFLSRRKLGCQVNSRLHTRCISRSTYGLSKVDSTRQSCRVKRNKST